MYIISDIIYVICNMQGYNNQPDTFYPCFGSFVFMFKSHVAVARIGGYALLQLLSLTQTTKLPCYLLLN